MDPSRPKPALGNFKAAAKPEQHIRQRHAHIGKFYFGMTMRRIMNNNGNPA